VEQTFAIFHLSQLFLPSDHPYNFGPQDIVSALKTGVHFSATSSPDIIAASEVPYLGNYTPRKFIC
jgi:hypothetical protein